MSSTDVRRGSRARPWIIPPATSRRPRFHLMGGTEILAELKGPLGVLLWLLHRDLELCTIVPPERRGSLFRLAGLRAFDHVQLPPPLAAEISLLTQTLLQAELTQAAGCCAAISEMTSGHAPRTALLFAETAAHALPASAPFARMVGIRARACGLGPQADSWFSRAAAVGRGRRDWSTYAHTYVDMGEAALVDGDFIAARAHFRRALRACLRYGTERSVRARAAVGLVRLALATYGHDQVDDLARRAIRSFPRRDLRRSRLRLQIATAYLAAGEHDRAVALLADLETERTGTGERMEAAALLLRTTAAAGDIDNIPARWEAFRQSAEIASTGHPADITTIIKAVLEAVDAAAPPPWLGTVLADAAKLAPAT